MESWGFLCAESEHPRGRGLPSSLRCKSRYGSQVCMCPVRQSAPSIPVFLPQA